MDACSMDTILQVSVLDVVERDLCGTKLVFRIHRFVVIRYLLASVIDSGRDHSMVRYIMLILSCILFLFLCDCTLKPLYRVSKLAWLWFVIQHFYLFLPNFISNLIDTHG